MTADGKSKRLRTLDRIPPAARLDHRLRNDPLAGLNRHERRKLKKNTQKVVAGYRTLMQTTRSNGAGYPVDQALRDFAIEYNHRFASSGTHTLPSSFNSFEPFLEAKLINGSAPSVALRPEKDHLFDLQDFLDFATSKEAAGLSLSELASQFPEGVIHHYSCIGDVMAFTLMSPSGRPFAISGVSLIRHGSSLHWYVLGGEVLDDDTWREYSEMTVEVNTEPVIAAKRPFITEVLQEKAGKPNRPVSLESTTQTLRTLFAGETDILTSKHLGRCSLRDFEESFLVVSDDPDIFGKEQLSDIEIATRQNNILAIEQAGVMWNLAECLFQLPAYFKFKFTLERKVQASGTLQIVRGHVGLSNPETSYSRFKVVSAIEVVPTTHQPALRAFTPPSYKVEIDGHWRRLAATTVGVGPEGQPVIGKTWVKAHNRWRERPDRPHTILVKSSIAAARLQIEKWQEAPEDQTRNLKSTSGDLYVIRCPLMDEEVYKVGWTSKTAQERADQLSSQTGVPMAFVVVESWRHADARELERAVHIGLARHRVNKGREFFKAPFETIRKVIISEIERMGPD